MDRPELPRSERAHRPVVVAALFLVLGGCKVAPPPVATVTVGPAAPTALSLAATAPPDDPRFTKLAAAVRDPRGQRVVRKPGLLVAEASALEALLGSTKPTSPDRPQIMRRLASTYLDLAEATSKEETPPPNADEAIRRGRAKGIALDEQLVGESPGYAQLDEVLYELGYQYEVAGDRAKARATYGDLLEKRPTSRLAANANLGLGELSYRLDADAALRSYLAATEGPPPQNKVYALALYRVGCVYRNRGDQQNADGAFRKALAACTADPSYDGPGADVPKLSDIVKASTHGR